MLCGALALSLALLLSSCSEPEDVTEDGVVKSGTGELRTELDPLVERLPALADVVGAEWMSGTLGGGAPGPSTYWIDAVVTLDEATLQEVMALPDLQAAEPPQVVSALQTSVPEAEFQQSSVMNSYFSDPGWYVEAWLAPDEGTVVLLILGGS